MHLKKKHLFRKYEGFLFYSEDVSRQDKVHGLYILLKPVMQWAKQSLVNLGLEPDEADSEIFILSERIFSKYNKERSSIVPYLERMIPWEVSKMLDRVYLYLNASGNVPYNSSVEKQFDEFFYFNTPNVLFEDRFIGKCFTRSEKYLIYKILTASDSELTTTCLAKSCKIDRKTMRNKLDSLKDKINWRN